MRLSSSAANGVLAVVRQAPSGETVGRRELRVAGLTINAIPRVPAVSSHHHKERRARREGPLAEISP